MTTHSSPRPMLMIPGPIEISDAALAASQGRPLSHLDPELIERFGASLRKMRAVWQAAPSSQPFVLSGGGTLAMEAVACNLVDPGERVVVIDTGYFGDRMADILRRRGAAVVRLTVPLDEALDLDRVERALDGRIKALFATHVDTSTGVRVDPEPLTELARANGALSVFDGVCATGAERFDMAGWGADVYLTASQKAIGLPAGLALWVASARAMRARANLAKPPPLTFDFEAWAPILQAYEQGEKRYLSTPATTLIPALDVSLDELLAEGMEAVFARHERAAAAMRAGFEVLGLEPLTGPKALKANTLSALRYPEGVGPELIARVREQGVVIAGGLHPAHKDHYFRVGHLGVVTQRPAALLCTIQALGQGLRDCGVAVDMPAAVEATERALRA
ncbi:MAG: alanine--glyoxylate aminotransferase family protein [Alphaproteobacteria bacterium]|nr:alanine--glyoxylate aminotransferase family protein [Alphaproteobacteria bacterium]